MNHTVPLADLDQHILDELDNRLGEASYDRYDEAHLKKMPTGAERIALRFRKATGESFTGKTLDPISFEDISVIRAPVEIVYRAVYVRGGDDRAYIIAVMGWKHICTDSDFDKC